MENLNEKGYSLLEYLSFQAGCMYLSDLPQAQNLAYTRHSLREMDPEQFSLKEWNDAAVYITRQEHDFKTSEQVRQYLLNFILTKE